MSLLKNLLTPTRKRKLRKIIAPFRRQGIKKRFSIISNNCWGGIQYDKFGLQYSSPTIGLHIPAQDFIKFCLNLEHYLSLTPIPVVDNTYNKHLKAKLDDILIEFVHYDNIDEAINKREKRKKRIVWDNIIVKFTDEYGEGQICNENTLELFSKVPYKKILFYSYNFDASKYSYAIKLSKHNDNGFITKEFKQASKRFSLRKLKNLINK